MSVYSLYVVDISRLEFHSNKPLTSGFQKAYYILKFGRSFILNFWFCYDGKSGPILGPFNFKKVIYSTGFYSPPVMKIEVYQSSQLSMESFAAESRRFRDTLAWKMANFGLILVRSLP